MPGALNVAATSPLLSRTLPLCVDGDMRFSAPWEAKAFAIVVELAQTGLFSWAEWVECFSKEVAAATAVEAGGGQPISYYDQWLNAAETMMVGKGVTSLAQLNARRFAIGAAGPAHVLK